jgi:hypothetical protein
MMLPLIALLLTAAEPAERSGLPASTPVAAAAGAAACRGLPDDYDAAVQQLLANGWARATTSGPAQPNAAPLPIFGRDDVIMVVPPPDAADPGRGTGCMVTAAFGRGVRWAEVVTAANSAFDAPAESISDSGAAWRLDGGRRLVMLMRRNDRGVLGATFIVAPAAPAN